MNPTMRGAVAHPLVVRIMAYQADMARGDLAAARGVFAPDVVYQVPGDNPLSGRHEGPDAVMGYLAKLMALTGGTYGISAMLWLTSGERVILATRNHATIAGESLDWDEAIAFEFADGRKKRIDLFQADQAGVDRFLARR